MAGDALQPVWLVSQGRVLAAARLAASRRDRRRGAIGLDELAEPIVLEPCRWVHTVGVRVPLDVAYVGSDGAVLATETMRPWRVGAPVRGARTVVEAQAGSFERWNLKPGDPLEVRRP
ncbi:MAG: DUF192 domain-containing protein [Ilumatobacteraceae bacterium]